jgi:hypothetical protein
MTSVIFLQKKKIEYPFHFVFSWLVFFNEAKTIKTINKCCF